MRRKTKTKTITFDLEVQPNGKTKMTDGSRAIFDKTVAEYEPGTMLHFKMIGEEEADYINWNKWFFGILIPIATYYLDLPPVCYKKPKIANDILKVQFASIRGDQFIKDGIGLDGKPTKTVFSLNLTDGIDYDDRMEYSEYVQGLIEGKAGMDYDQVELMYREEHNIPPNEKKYKIKRKINEKNNS